MYIYIKIKNMKGGMNMKRLLCLFMTSFLVLSLVSFAIAQGPQDGTGESHDEIISAGGQNGSGQQGDNTDSGNGSSNGTGLQDNVKTNTQNQGEETNLQNQIKEQNQVRSGNYQGANGEQVQVQEKSNNKIELKVGNSKAQTALELTAETDGEKTNFKTTLSNGRNAEIKVMPDTASEKALEQLRLKVCSEENGCAIELKEVGKSQEEKQLAYEVQAERHSRILGIFKKKMQVQAQVDAETGEVIQTNKPWWAFLATEPVE